MQSKTRQIRRRGAWPMRGDFLVRLLSCLRPTAIVVSQLVGREITFGQPRAGFEADDIESSLGERKRGNASNRAKTHDDDIGLLQPSRHASSRRVSNRCWLMPS